MSKNKKQVTIRRVIIHIIASLGTVALVSIIYFYFYLPSLTNQGVIISVPDLINSDVIEIERLLKPLGLRYEVIDSSYDSNKPALVTLQQVPKAGHKVKPNHKIYVTLNREVAPTVPLPNLFGKGNSGSLINAEAVLKSAGIIRGNIIYTRHQSRDLIVDILYKEESIKPGTLIPKKSIIDLVVGDGRKGMANYFLIPDYVGMPYNNVLLRLENFGLRLGEVQLTDDMDTTGIVPYVIKQVPEAGDSVRIGSPVNLWIGLDEFEFYD